MSNDLLDVTIMAVQYWTYYRWYGSPTIRGYELHRYRMYIECYGAQYRVSRRKEMCL